jgi:hypothetical protein
VKPLTHPGSPVPPGRDGARPGRVLPRALAAALLAVGPLATACSHGTAPASTPGPPERLPVGTLGGYRIAEHRVRFVDRSRPRLGPRALPTTVWYPVIPQAAAASGRLARGLFPLVVFGPGYAQCAAGYGPLERAWASAGYVVAGVDFPVTNCRAIGPESDMVNQPADMAYVIRRMLAVSARPRGFLSGLVDPARIAVAGQSDGGDTVAALVADTCCRDRAIRAAIVLAGAEYPPMGGSYFTEPAPPVLFVQGDADTINPAPLSITMYRSDTVGPRFYLDLLGAPHLPPYQGQGPSAPVVARVTVDFLDRYLTGSPGAGTAMRRDGRVPGVATLVSGGRLPPS